MKIRKHKETFQTTMAYVCADGWGDAVYRIDTKGRCSCEGYRNPVKGCKHTNGFAKAVEEGMERGYWESDLDIIVTPWAAEELGLVDIDGVAIRPTP